MFTVVEVLNALDGKPTATVVPPRASLRKEY